MVRKIHSIKMLFILISICLITYLVGAGAAGEMKDLDNMILDFSSAEDKTSWQIVNDGVMGGFLKARFSSKKVEC